MEKQVEKQAYQTPRLGRQELLAELTELALIASGEPLPR